MADKKKSIREIDIEYLTQLFDENADNWTDHDEDYDSEKCITKEKFMELGLKILENV